jgi:hypothetical protein
VLPCIILILWSWCVIHTVFFSSDTMVVVSLLLRRLVSFTL